MEFIRQIGYGDVMPCVISLVARRTAVQSIKQVVGDAVQHRVAVVQATGDECLDRCFAASTESTDRM